MPRLQNGHASGGLGFLRYHPVRKCRNEGRSVLASTFGSKAPSECLRLTTFGLTSPPKAQSRLET